MLSDQKCEGGAEEEQVFLTNHAHHLLCFDGTDRKVQVNRRTLAFDGRFNWGARVPT